VNASSAGETTSRRITDAVLARVLRWWVFIDFYETAQMERVRRWRTAGISSLSKLLCDQNYSLRKKFVPVFFPSFFPRAAFPSNHLPSLRHLHLDQFAEALKAMHASMGACVPFVTTCRQPSNHSCASSTIYAKYNQSRPPAARIETKRLPFANDATRTDHRIYEFLGHAERNS